MLLDQHSLELTQICEEELAKVTEQESLERFLDLFGEEFEL